MAQPSPSEALSVALANATPEQPVRVGRYDVTGLLGAGGMGTVYDAVDREHGTRVALKTLTHLAPESLLRFKNEFRSVADLSHPNLVPLYELGCHEGRWYFTMERIEGVGFLHWIRGAAALNAPTAEQLPAWHSEPTTRRGASSAHHVDPPVAPAISLSLPRLRDAFAQLVRGVRALHEAGLLHLDLKPGNVLVDRAGRVVILDFGLARTIENASDTPGEVDTLRILGTPTWMAPEQYAGARVSEPADWYAVGLMLYSALTGAPAFAPDSVAVLWYAKLHVPPTPPEQLLDGVPADLSALAMALLHPDPARRPTGPTLLALTSGDAGAQTQAEKLARGRLVGRELERDRLRDAVAHVREGGAAVVLLLGPGGVGKSALLRSLREEAQAQGALVLYGRCYEREAVPCKAFDGLLDELGAWMARQPAGSLECVLPAWSGELARVFPVLAAVPSVATRGASEAALDALSGLELRRRAVEALRELFAALAARRPLVLALDDLQWADAESATLLRRILEEPAPPGLLLAASLRPQEASANPAASACLAGVRKLADKGALALYALTLGPLAQSEAERLAAETLVALEVRPKGLAALLAREAGGHPLFIEELAHFVAQQKSSGIEPTTQGIALETVLARRVQALPPAERSLVEVLAVAGSPLPLSVAYAAAGLGQGVRRALWSLRGGHFVRSTGARPHDQLELHHDRTREAVLAALPADRRDALHLALGRALAPLAPWLFDAVQHLTAARHELAPPERDGLARLALAAGRRARGTAAFSLAFSCFKAGIDALDSDPWHGDHALALGLYSGAAEAAYLSAAWEPLDALIDTVKAHGRTVLEQLVGWEVQLDAHIARTEYDDAVGAALEALALLGVQLPGHPTRAEVGAELERTMAALARVGPDALASLPLAAEPEPVAAMRLQGRIMSAAYFARPQLFPLLACRLVRSSLEHGLSPATPYALAVYGVVLNSLGMLTEAHRWGTEALGLLERFDDKSHDARTRHVVHDLVCTWTVPLASTLDALRDVVSLGRRTGDLEYAGYAAHGYVHNALYAARGLEGLLVEALAFGAFLRSCEQVNALHVHKPFEQVLRCLTGRSGDPSRLDGDGFDEARALDTALTTGSRSARFLLGMLMGLTRYHFGSAADASAHFEAARPYLDGVASTWHVPIFHQFAALAALALPDEPRRALDEAYESSLEALRALAVKAPANFAHRVALLEAERARVEGDKLVAIERFARAGEGASRGAWHHDLGLAHELAARMHQGAEAERHLGAARAAYGAWGARALVERLGAR